MDSWMDVPETQAFHCLLLAVDADIYLHIRIGTYFDKWNKNQDKLFIE